MTSPSEGASIDVSIVIPHHGAPEPTRDLLADLSARRTDRTVEVIVVDDASPDPFVTDTDVTVIRRVSNGGFGTAVNTGASAARGTWLVILNSDLRVDPDFVEMLVARAEAYRPAVVGPRLVDDAGIDQFPARRYPRVSHQVVEWLVPLVRFRSRPALQRAVGYDLAARPGRDTLVDWLVGAALCLRLQDYRAVEGFDERFFMNCDEVDLQVRLAARGIPSVLAGDIEVTHLGGGSTPGAARRSWLSASRRQYAEKWGGLRRLQVALTAATAVNTIWNCARRLRDPRVRPIEQTHRELELIWAPLHSGLTGDDHAPGGDAIAAGDPVSP